MNDFLIIGADAAGLSAASQIKRKSPHSSLKVINREEIISYAACGIPYVLSGDIPSMEELIHFTPQTIYKAKGIPVEVQKEAVEIFPERHEVKVKNMENGEIYREAYGKLMIATGGAPKKLPFLDYGQRGVFSVHNLKDLKLILQYMKEKNPQTAAIIGCGNIGLEMTEALYKRGMETLLFEIMDKPIPTWPSFIQEEVFNKLNKNRIPFHAGTALKSVKKKREKFILQEEDREYSADMIFSIVGITPETEFCGQKLKKMENGALLIDRHGQTSDPDIYSAGDCASVFHKLLNRQVYIPLGSIANKMGRVAGLNMAGENISHPGIVGTQIFKFFELSLARTGLSFQEAQKEGIQVQSFTSQRRDKPGYYPDAHKSKAELLLTQEGKVVGASVASEGNAVQEIDPLAVAVYSGLKADELGWFDSAYTPPYAPVWNSWVSSALKGIKT